MQFNNTSACKLLLEFERNNNKVALKYHQHGACKKAIFSYSPPAWSLFAITLLVPYSKIMDLPMLKAKCLRLYVHMQIV